MEFGDPDITLTFSIPVKLTLAGQAGKTAHITEGVTTSEITTICNSPDPTAVSNIPTTFPQSCKIDSGADLLILTETASRFSTGTRSSDPSGPSGPSGGVSSGGSGSTGASPSGSSGGFGGILGTPLAINEVSYDKCDENMVRILVSSDADEIPTVVLHTTRSGTVYAVLAEDQPFEEFNQFSSINKYVFEAPIASDETFMMVVLTEIKGKIINKVQAPVYLTSCTGSTTIVELPEEEEEISFDVPRIFDMKFQIGNGTMYNVESESGLFYLDGEDLTVTALIDSKFTLLRV